MTRASGNAAESDFALPIASLSAVDEKASPGSGVSSNGGAAVSNGNPRRPKSSLR
jgi:hypothetical protein